MKVLFMYAIMVSKLHHGLYLRVLQLLNYLIHGLAQLFLRLIKCRNIPMDLSKHLRLLTYDRNLEQSIISNCISI